MRDSTDTLVQFEFMAVNDSKNDREHSRHGALLTGAFLEIYNTSDTVSIT